ncbi:MAG TPA: amidohydrolase [Thermoanaerobaculia bacterium]|jgi:aminobenzoyl-glutamate utilization protein B|nr:amidohydrolase [Thermoanaerobaculia bacterium]
MKTALVLILIVAVAASAATTPNVAEKLSAAATIDRNRDQLTALSDEVWRYAETALKETRSSKTLADFAEKNGFRVTRGVANMPTAFVAEFGAGRPIIGILGEYDALPGISQKAQSSREALEAGAPGHGCGHNLFGVGSLGAAIAVKELIAAGKLNGTIRFFGTPAEEAVGGKLYMLREGVMNGVDVMLSWHPADRTEAETKSTQALMDIEVEFRGRAAHAAYDPWNGRSAVDGLEIFTHAVNMMREHVKPTARMHYAIVNGGDVPNVVPEYAKVWIWLRDLEMPAVEEMFARLKKMAEGAALAADVTSKVTVRGGDWNMNVNMTGQRLMYSNLMWLGPMQFTSDEQEFAKAIQRATNVPEKGLNPDVKPFETNPGPAEGGSTDVGDVSWKIPTITMQAVTAPVDTPWHGWPVVACGGMSIGHKGMIYAAKALAATMIDLYKNPKNIEEIRREFAEDVKESKFRSYIPEGPPVLPPSR